LGDGVYEATTRRLEPATTYTYRVIARRPGREAATEPATFTAEP
jgi:hypothetical protein